MILSIFFIVLAYLMGSICSAVMVSKTCNLPDPRSEGSKNPGATNVLRLAGKKYAILVLLIDVLKGTIPVVIARIFEADTMALGFTALAAVIGHMYPVFFDFQGGKGVATAIGALLGFNVLVGIMAAVTWLLVAKFSRYSSLSSVVSILLSPFYALAVTGHWGAFLPLFFMALLIIVKHKENICRLIEGTESKIKLKQHNVLEDVMEDDQAEVVAPVAVKEVSKEAAETKPAKAKTSTKTAVKKPKKAASTEEKPAKKASTAKKPAAKKPVAKKPKLEKPQEDV